MVNINENCILFQRMLGYLLAIRYLSNKELFIFQVLGYQFGLCLICTQFTTSGTQLVNNITTVQPNSTTAIEK